MSSSRWVARATTAAQRVTRRLSSLAGLRVFRLFARPLADAAHAAALNGLDIRLLSAAEVVALCGEADLDLRRESVDAACSRGDFCVAAYECSALAGYCWFAFAPLRHLDDVWVRFGSEGAWAYKSFVRASHRGRGIAARLYRFADSSCRERGRVLSIICVESHNAPSVTAALRAGYEYVGPAAYLRRGALFVARYSTAVRRHGVSFFIASALQKGTHA